MVSFSCEACGDVLTKKKLDPHRSRCRGATFTCIDCMVYFPGFEYRSHTSCMTEEQKYQGALYKPKTKKGNQGQQAKANQEFKASQETMAHRAYVKDATEEYGNNQDSEVQGGKSVYNTPPEVPMPPPAVAEEKNVNVFDYLCESTPASKVNLPLGQTPKSSKGASNDVDDKVCETPAPKAHKKKSKDSEKKSKDSEKKDKKRKRANTEASPAAAAADGDEVMTDAPPVLHSGLTEGLNRMIPPSQFPPSPDYSGDAAREGSPATPTTRKKKHSTKSPKASRDSLGSGFMNFMSGGAAAASKTKVSKKRKDASERKEKKRKTSTSDEKKSPKMIEFRGKAGEEKEKGDESGALVVYKPRSDLFLSLCDKGPESDRGCSVRKALKRFHRERTSTGKSLSKGMEEKELWRSLRMRKNERGEIVLFALEEETA